MPPVSISIGLGAVRRITGLTVDQSPQVAGFLSGCLMPADTPFQLSHTGCPLYRSPQQGSHMVRSRPARDAIPLYHASPFVWVSRAFEHLALVSCFRLCHRMFRPRHSETLVELTSAGVSLCAHGFLASSGFSKIDNL